MPNKCKNEFEPWLSDQRSEGLCDIKFAIGGDTSEASVRVARDEIVRLEKMAEANICYSPSYATDYSNELRDLDKALLDLNEQRNK